MMKSPSVWSYRLQLAVLIGLVASMMAPYVGAQTIPDLPSSIPTTTALPSSLSTNAASDQAARQLSESQAALDREARDRQRSLERSTNDALRQRLESANVPADPTRALNGDSPEAASTVARVDGLRAVDQSLAANNLPPADAAALVQGNAGSLIDSGVTNPAAITNAISQASRSYTNARNESLFATAQANWASGVKGFANCSSGDDDGKDFCQALEDLKTVLNEIKTDMRETVNMSHRLQAYVTAKPAFLNTPSLTHPICNGLTVPGVNVPLTTVDIATTDQAYDPASGRLTLEAVRNELIAAGNLAENLPSIDNNASALSSGVSLIRNNDGLYRSNVTDIQGIYDRLTQRIWQNFDTTITRRFQTLKKHTEEMNTLAEQLNRIEDMLAKRPRTP